MWKKDSDGPELSSIASNVVDAAILNISKASTNGKYDISVACIDNNHVYCVSAQLGTSRSFTTTNVCDANDPKRIVSYNKTAYVASMNSLSSYDGSLHSMTSYKLTDDIVALFNDYACPMQKQGLDNNANDIDFLSVYMKNDDSVWQENDKFKMPSLTELSEDSIKRLSKMKLRS